MKEKNNQSTVFDLTIKPSAFPPETAGRLMAVSVPLATAGMTIAEIESFLLKQIREFETINYIYIVNHERKLRGVISIKELYRLSKSESVGTGRTTNLVSVRPHTDQERIVWLAIKHNLKSIPVVDNNHRLLGVVTSDTILNILNQETIEDALHSAGIHPFSDPARELLTISPVRYFNKRLPWLVAGLGGGVLAAWVISWFEKTLTEMIVLAAFIPAIVYLADAVGAQSQTVFVRSLALTDKLNFKKYLQREMIVAGLLALVLSSGGGLFTGWWWQSPTLGLILFLSFFLTIILAAFTGVVMPWIFVRLKTDPAISAGPLATIIRDIISVIIYFSLATFLLNLL
ncbi:MAG: magnesium transporter [Candidatus Paceibacterota bacterium]